MESFNDPNNTRLPISSFGNICLLLDTDNRKKRDKIIYDDAAYISKVNLENIEENLLLLQKMI